MTDPADITLPAIQVFNDRFGRGKQGGEGEIVGFLTIHKIFGTNGNPVHVAQDIQFGQCNIGSSLNLDAIAGCDNVNGTDTAGASGFCAVFKTGGAQGIRLVPKHFAHERAFANTGGVCLDNTDYLIDFCRGQTGTDRGIGADGVGGGGIRINTVVQIPKGTELGFKQDILAIILGFSQNQTGIADKRLDSFTPDIKPLVDIGYRHGFFAVDSGNCQILPFQKVCQMLLQTLRMQKLSCHNGFLLVFVRVEGGNALFGGTVFFVFQPGFLQLVQFPVPGKQQ